MSFLKLPHEFIKQKSIGITRQVAVLGAGNAGFAFAGHLVSKGFKRVV